MLAAGGFDAHLLGEGWEKAGLPFGLAGEDRCAADWAEVERGPEFHEPVESVEAKRVLIPARAESCGQVAVARPIDLLDPCAEACEGVFAFVSVKLHHREARPG
jgi:hypothetical protein